MLVNHQNYEMQKVSVSFPFPPSNKNNKSTDTKKWQVGKNAREGGDNTSRQVQSLAASKIPLPQIVNLSCYYLSLTVTTQTLFPTVRDIIL